MNRVKYTSTTTGTGALTLSVVTQFQGEPASINTFAGADAVIYTIIDGDGTDWETGYGTISGTTLTRSAVFESTNADALVSLSANTHTVLISRSFYEGHTITASFIPATTGVVTFSTSTTDITWAQEGQNANSSIIDGDDDCPGQAGGAIATLCANPKAEIPYCRGYSLHMRAYVDTTQASDFWALEIDTEGFGTPIAQAWAPITTGYYLSVTSPIIEAKNPFTGTSDLIDQDTVTYGIKNSSGASIDVYPQLYITWYL